MVHENFTWVDHMTTVENKLSENLGLFYKGKNYLNSKSIVNLYSFIHSYFNCGNITWCSTSITKPKKLASKQKQALQIIPIFTLESELHSKQIMKELCILSIHQLNIYIKSHV